MRLRLTACLFVFATVTLPAVAQVPATCGDAATQAAANQCASEKFSTADKQLNAVYAELAGKLASDNKGYLREAQRAWISFRDKECTLRTGGGPAQQGSIWPMLYTECRTALTRARIEDLKAQVKCPGGDLSCPL
ncbi:lysozyme inhibitor LprI family protein [Microvirga antarctica]|uniref:lysozyme inhibitor LprI family protein n=1 Tax=Microvirga antarctica TaxID=2819233 RepID=UPI001B310B1A|nr:lysozyme inhibitor LprI family protein [Microvirga antarctica]